MLISGITLVALVVTIVVLLILVGITINYMLGDNNIFTKASQAKEQTAIASAREKLENVLLQAKIDKHVETKYNQNEYLDEMILDKVVGAKVIGDIAISNGYAFILDRNIPWIGEYIGKEEKLLFPTIDVVVELEDNKKSAMFTITVLEKEKGINKIEIWQKGEMLKQFIYNENIKTQITEQYIVKNNGKYVIKAYGELMSSEIVTVDGILVATKFEPNGNYEWKKEHSTKIIIEETEDKVIKAKYQWTDSIAEPTDTEFPEEHTFKSGDIISNDKLSGKYYLWTMLETQSGENIKFRSEEFRFDNEGPTVQLTAIPTSETSFTLTATATDRYSGVAKYKFYVDDNEYNPQNVVEQKATYTWKGTEVIENKPCRVVVWDQLGNFSESTYVARTKLYKWDTYSYTKGRYYEELRGRSYITKKNSDTVTLYTKKSWTPEAGYAPTGRFYMTWDEYLWKNKPSFGAYLWPSKNTMYRIDERTNYNTQESQVLVSGYELVYRPESIGSKFGNGVTSNQRNAYPDNRCKCVRDYLV